MMEEVKKEKKGVTITAHVKWLSNLCTNKEREQRRTN